MLRRNKASSSSSSLAPLSGGSAGSAHPGVRIDIEYNRTDPTLTGTTTTSDEGRSRSRMDAAITPSPPAPPRSESMAYAAHSPAGTLASKVAHYVRFNPSRVVAGVGLLLVAVVLLTDDGGEGGKVPRVRVPVKYVRGAGRAADQWGGAVHPGYFAVEQAKVDDRTWRFAVVTDLDKLSVVKESNKPLFRSTLLPGILTRDDETNKYTVKFEPHRTLVSQHNEAGRGMELSELTIYQKRLLSFDDRTGTVFEILSTADGGDSYAVPRFVITEGDGDTDKGMKWEWATVKDSELILGSMGKEFTGPGGVIENTNNLWVAVLNARGELRREDWKGKFDFVRGLVSATYPGCECVKSCSACHWFDFLCRYFQNDDFQTSLWRRSCGLIT
ncbi:hypothetical protein ACHAWF_010915 [Thalassiosira exigua]